MLWRKIEIYIIKYNNSDSKKERSISISVKSETLGDSHSQGLCSDQKSILLTGTLAGPLSCRRADRIVCTAIACGTTARQKSRWKCKRTVRFLTSESRALRCVSSNRTTKKIHNNKQNFLFQWIWWRENIMFLFLIFVF